MNSLQIATSLTYAAMLNYYMRASLSLRISSPSSISSVGADERDTKVFTWLSQGAKVKKIACAGGARVVHGRCTGVRSHGTRRNDCKIASRHISSGSGNDTYLGSVDESTTGNRMNSRNNFQRVRSLRRVVGKCCQTRLFHSGRFFFFTRPQLI